MADYYINSDYGKQLAGSLKAGDMAEASDGSTWRKEADGSVTVWKNGQTMTGRVGVSAPAVSEAPSSSASTTVETPTLDAATGGSSQQTTAADYTGSAQEQRDQEQAQARLASEKAKAATEKVTAGLDQSSSDELLNQAIQQASTPEYKISSAQGVLLADELRMAGDMAEASDGSTWRREADGSISVRKGDRTYKANVDRAAAKQDPQWAILTAPAPAAAETGSGKKSSGKSSSGSASSSGSGTYTFPAASTGTQKTPTATATGTDRASLRKQAATAQKEMGDLARQISVAKIRGKDTSALQEKYNEAKARYDAANTQIQAPQQLSTSGARQEQFSQRQTLMELATQQAAERKDAWKSLPTVRDSERFSGIDNVTTGRMRSAEQQQIAGAVKELQKDAWRSLPTVQDSGRFNIPSQTDSLMQQAIAKTPRTLSGKPYLPENDGGFSHSSGSTERQNVLERIGNAALGGLIQSGGTSMDAAGTMYQAGQGGRNTTYNESRAWFQDQLDSELRTLNSMLLENQDNPGTYTQAEIKNQRRIVAEAQARVNAFALTQDAQEQSGELARDLAADVSNAGAGRVAQSKRGASKLGSMALDALASAAQSGADMATNALLGTSGSMLPFAFRAFGGGTQQARNDGATLGQQLAYGGTMAAKEVFTEKMFNIAGLQSKAYGKGSFDDYVEKAVAGAVDKLASTDVGKRLLGGAAQFMTSAAGEGLEELIGDWMEWQLPQIYGKDPDSAKDVAVNSLYDFLVGAISGVMGNLTTPGQFTNYDVNEHLGGRQGQQVNRQLTQDELLDAAMQAANRGETLTGPVQAANQTTKQTTHGTAERGAEGVITGNAASEDLAPNGLKKFDFQEVINLSTGKKNVIISTVNDFKRFIQNTLSNKGEFKRAYLGKVTDAAAQKAKSAGMDITNYTVMMSSDDIAHTFKRHGDAQAEAKSGQIAVTPDSLSLLTEVISNPDSVEADSRTDGRGRPVLLFRKYIDGNYVAVEAVSDSKKTISTDTMYIQKKNPHVAEYNAFVSESPVHNTQSDLPQGSSRTASVSDDTDVPARSGSTGQSPPGNHVPDAPYNTSYNPTVAQPGNSVNQNVSANDMGAMRSQFESVPKQAQTQSNTINSMETGWDVPEAQRTLTQDELLDYAIQAANRGEILASPPQRMSESSGQNVKTMNQMGTDNAYASAEENAAARSYTHERISTAEQFARANGRILTDADGNVSNYAGQVQELLAADHWNNTDRDVAATLRHEAFQRGDMNSFYQLSDRITETNTEAGRTLQGTQKWLEQAHPEQSVVAAAKKALDTNPKAPSGKMAFIEKTAREISGFGDNVSQWAGALKQIAEERRMTGVDMLVRMAEKQGANDPQWLKSLVYNGLYNVAGDYEKPTGAVDTVNKGLRRLKSYVITNQLFRVTTNAANVVSNSISNVTEAAAANTGTAHLADVIMSQFTGLRSHGMFENVLGREALTTGKNLAQKSFVEIWLDTSTDGTDSKFQGSKGRAVREYKMTGNQLFSTIDAVLSTALNTTDAFATGVSQGAAQTALRRNVQKGYLTAEQALDVAEQRGSDTTFHNKTALGTTLQRVQAAMNGGLEYGAGNIVAGNYLNVPAAVLMREVSKMPTIGTVGALIDMAAVCIDGKTGKNTIGDLQAKITGEKLTLAQRQSRAAQQLGRSLALGTMEVAGYAALALKGIIRRVDDDDKDKAAFEAAGGQQGLYINWSALWRSVPGGDSEWQDGDVITNLGRLEPLTVNMNFGIDVAEALKTDEGLRAEDLKGISISAVQDGIADLSMIQNIQGIINALQYKGEDQSAFEAVGQELLASNVASLTPGLIQQAAKAIDPYYRDLYTGDTSGQQIYDIWANTIPGLRQQLPEKLTGFGTPKEYAGTDTERAVNALLNPYATTTVRPKTGMESMLQEAEDVSVYPNRSPIGSVSVNGQTVTLTNEQKRQYQTVYGQTYQDTLQALQGSIAFRQLDRQVKDAAMKAAESYAGTAAKTALDIGYKPPEDYAERTGMDGAALANALILEAVKSQKYLSPETQAAKSSVENRYSSTAYARQSLNIVNAAKEKATAYFEHVEQAKYGGELTDAEQELSDKDAEYIADYFMRKAIDSYKNADGTPGHLSGDNATKYAAVAKKLDGPTFAGVGISGDILTEAKKKAHSFYTEVEKTGFGGIMSADNRALNRKFAKMSDDEIAQYFLSIAAKEKFKDTNGNGTNLDETAAALKSGDINDATVFMVLDDDTVENYTRYGKGSSITPEILLQAARAKQTVKQDTDQDSVVVNTSQEQFEDWVNRQSWTQQQKQDVMKVFYPNTAEKKNYLVESLNSGRMKYTDAKKELTPTLQAGWTHQLLPTLAENANDTTKGALMSHYIEAAAAYDDRPNAAERKALNYSYAWQWFCDYLNTTDMTREQKYQVALIMSGTDSQKTKDKIWSRLK